MPARVIPVPLCRFGYCATCIIGFIPWGGTRRRNDDLLGDCEPSLGENKSHVAPGATLPSIAPSVWPLSPPALHAPAPDTLPDRDGPGTYLKVR